jgi:hypothetical protein
MKMKLWNRSSGQEGPPRRRFTTPRGPNRTQRIQLEPLEGRALLSTYSISEYMFFGARHLVETVNNVTTDLNLGSNPSTFTLNTGSGTNTVNIQDTSAGIAIKVIGSGGTDTVNVGNPGSGGSVQGVQAPIYVQNPPAYTTLNVNDAADTTARPIALSSTTVNNQPWGSIIGLAPANIYYAYHDTNAVNITTGKGNDTVNVLATGGNGHAGGVATNLSSSGGADFVIVGNAASVQGINGTLSIQDPPAHTTLTINDSSDTSTRTATLSTYSSGGYNWGSITGLAPAAINFKYADTSSPVNVATAVGSVTWNVSANAMASSTGVQVLDNLLPINQVPTQPLANQSYSPAPAGTPLFNNGGPSFLDVRQGAAADCWLLSAMAEAAARAPQDIKNMFTYDGTIVDTGATVGLYTVRFFNNAGTPVYVQVDTELPGGGGYYDHVQNGLGTQVLWVALAEKAYAEANGLGYVTTNHLSQNSYGALDYGLFQWSLQALTGQPGSDTGLIPANLATAMATPGRLVEIATPKGPLPSSFIQGGHCYAVVGYNPASSKPYEVFNPYGTDASGWVPGQANKTYGLFWTDAAFIQQNFHEQNIAVGAALGPHAGEPVPAPAPETAIGVDLWLAHYDPAPGGLRTRWHGAF